MEKDNRECWYLPEGSVQSLQGCTKVWYTCSLGEKIAAWSFPRGRHINVHTISSGEVTTSPA